MNNFFADLQNNVMLVSAVANIFLNKLKIGGAS